MCIFPVFTLLAVEGEQRLGLAVAEGVQQVARAAQEQRVNPGSSSPCCITVSGYYLGDNVEM